jgi:hypothetical protein
LIFLHFSLFSFRPFSKNNILLISIGKHIRKNMYGIKEREREGEKGEGVY